MNQLMTLERVDKVELVKSIIAPWRSNKTIVDAPCADIAIAALDRFRSCHNFELKRLLCEVRAGILTIRGQVSSYYVKQLAQETLRSLEGVIRIINRLEVVYDQKNHGEVEIQ